MACLVVVDERGGKRNYCPICAKPMLMAAMNNLRAFGFGIGLVELVPSGESTKLSSDAA